MIFIYSVENMLGQAIIDFTTDMKTAIVSERAQSIFGTEHMDMWSIRLRETIDSDSTPLFIRSRIMHWAFNFGGDHKVDVISFNEGELPKKDCI